MEPLSLNDIREKFLAFFEARDHLRLPSFSLVPQQDPSILLINAGMTPLKPYFTGAQKPPAPRVATCQKCIRTPDIERVGITSRHGTFFEMLGNFSFGDYFKEEIIPWAWEFCTQGLSIPPQRLHVSVYESDDEAYDLWHRKVGLAKERIVRLGKEDNFWEHGVGPCGPCSEIHYDRGEAHGCDDPDCKPGCDCDRFVEIWNLVFTQYYRQEDGTYTPLEQKNIDTGAGLERLAAVLQGVDSLFEVDTIKAILDAVCKAAGATYGQNKKQDVALRVVTDHVRSTTMMICDGIIPSNEGRGYVLRRLLRRAARYGRLLGIEKPFLSDLSRIVIRESEKAYPDLGLRQDYIEKIIRIEEDRFGETIQQGLGILQSLLEAARAQKQTTLSGQEVFRLHDTFGFPLDLTREIAAEEGIDIDEAGFQEAMAAQREKARQALKDKSGSAWSQDALPAKVRELPPTDFCGYESMQKEAKVLALLFPREGSQLGEVEQAKAGQRVKVIVDRTPFYAQAGGQIGDQGSLSAAGLKLQIEDTQKTAEGLYLHDAVVREGVLRKGSRVTLQVDRRRRLETARNHTATHLLHQALRQVLGAHVTQAGSSVSPQRLRFDFSHFQPLSQAEMSQIEKTVNEAILSDLAVQTRVMSLDEARRQGAVALFDEKYDDTVRVVSVGSFSQELCGGTHLERSSQACLFCIESENGIAAGVRRIEAVTGTAAHAAARENDETLLVASELLKTKPQELAPRIQGLLEQTRQLEKQLQAYQKEEAGAAAASLLQSRQDVGGIQLIAARLPGCDARQLRETAERLRSQADPALVVLATETGGKVLWVAMAGKEAVARGLHAGQIVREAAKLTGGGGGGRPDMAQAGGKKPEGIDDALQQVRKMVAEKLA